jgi:hypothetical protein
VLCECFEFASIGTWWQYVGNIIWTQPAFERLESIYSSEEKEELVYPQSIITS